MFSLKPKLIVGAIVLTLAMGAAWHYRHVIAENADLTKRVLALMQENDSLATQLEAEREAAAVAVRERRRAEAALATLQAGQAADTAPEYVEWSAQRIPPTELARICTALPEMDGCEQP